MDRYFGATLDGACRLARTLRMSAEVADAQGFAGIPLNDRFSSRQIELLPWWEVTLFACG